MSQRTAPAHHVVEPADPEMVSMGMPTLVARSPEWAPEVDARLARVGMRMWIGADVFFFVAWFFAFFYLRALNNNHDWKPVGVDHPNLGVGAVILILILASTVLYWVGARAVMAQTDTARRLFWLAFLAGVACVIAQFYEFQHLGFDPQLGGGYPSVFVGLKAVWLVQVVGAMFWVATQI
jgi:heme/copper-type cytochrome/quinol oxidase subunit 3